MATVPRLAFFDGYLLMMVAVGWAVALARRPQTRPWVRRIPLFAVAIQLAVLVFGVLGMMQVAAQPDQAASLMDGVQLAATFGIAACLLADVVGTVQSFAAPKSPPAG